jgi:hypothetical protein
MSQQILWQQHSVARAPEKHLELESWENDGGACGGGTAANDRSHSDLNSLLAQEQTAIMNEEAATTPAGREGHREEARRLRELVELTPFPARAPHDFERRGSPRPDEFARNFETLKQRVEEMERLLAKQFSEGLVGVKHNTYQHRSRLIWQARESLASAQLR